MSCWNYVFHVSCTGIVQIERHYAVITSADSMLRNYEVKKVKQAEKKLTLHSIRNAAK